MSVKTYFDKQNQILVQEFTGELKTADLLNAQKTALSKIRKLKAQILWDNRKANTTNLSYDQVKYLAQSSQSIWQNRGPLRTAILVTDQVEFGMARMYQALAGDEKQEIAIFDDLSQAMDWLNSR